MDFPQIMREVRDGLTQRELAQELGVSRQTINMWENGQAEPDMENVLKVLEYVDGERKEEIAEHFGLRDILQVLINELGVRAR